MGLMSSFNLFIINILIHTFRKSFHSTSTTLDLEYSLEAFEVDATLVIHGSDLLTCPVDYLNELRVIQAASHELLEDCADLILGD